MEGLIRREDDEEEEKERVEGEERRGMEVKVVFRHRISSGQSKKKIPASFNRGPASAQSRVTEPG
jgi:hypothetical protein